MKKYPQFHHWNDVYALLKYCAGSSRTGSLSIDIIWWLGIYFLIFSSELYYSISTLVKNWHEKCRIYEVQEYSEPENDGGRDCQIIICCKKLFCHRLTECANHARTYAQKLFIFIYLFFDTAPNGQTLYG